MPNLNPAFEAVTSFQDFTDTLRANPAATSFTRNDMVRGWNILVHARSFPSNIITLRYAEINISQSSVRTIVSKLNMLFRHLGLIDASQTIRIDYSDFYTANINIACLHEGRILPTLGWHLGSPAYTQGRRQDRVETRHVNGHRARRGAGERNLPLDAPSDFGAAASVEAPTGFSIAGILDGFNPFAGLSMDVLATLRGEANG